MFDFNFDGNIDAMEMGLGCMMVDEFEKDEAKEELMCAGIDPDELEFLDDDECVEILCENGLDPDDFDF